MTKIWTEFGAVSLTNNSQSIWTPEGAVSLNGVEPPDAPPLTGNIQYYTGTQFKKATMKVFNGNCWVDARLFRWNGTNWINTFDNSIFKPTQFLDGLDGYWKLDETSGDRADSSGNGLTLTDVNSVSSVAGKIGNAAVFSPTPDKQLIRADDPKLRFGESWTISAWIYRTSPSFSTRTVLSKIREIEIYNSSDFPNGNKLVMRVFNNAGTIVGTLRSDIAGEHTLDTWWHVICYRDGNTLGMVVNGVPEEEVTINSPGSTYGFTGTFRIGALDSGYSWSGYIDEVGKWNRKLSPLEMSQLYGKGNGRNFSLFTS